MTNYCPYCKSNLNIAKHEPWCKAIGGNEDPGNKQSEGRFAGTLTVILPEEVLPYKTDIARFVEAMIYKLKVHHKKGKWEDRNPKDNLGLLGKEVVELTEAVEGGNMVEIMLEAADVANFALIQASIAVEKK